MQSASFLSSPRVYIGQMIPGDVATGVSWRQGGNPADLVLHVLFLRHVLTRRYVTQMAVGVVEEEGLSIVSYF